MPARLSRDQRAVRAGQARELVERLVELGILRPDGPSGGISPIRPRPRRPSRSSAAACAARRVLARILGAPAVKWLGDGVMFHFDDPACPAASARSTSCAKLRHAVEVGARVGVSAGPVVFQDGDHLGRTVNVVARVADYARPDEVVVSRDVLAACDHAGVDFGAIGEIPLKGVRTPVGLFRALAA